MFVVKGKQRIKIKNITKQYILTKYKTNRLDKKIYETHN